MNQFFDWALSPRVWILWKEASSVLCIFCPELLPSPCFLGLTVNLKPPAASLCCGLHLPQGCTEPTSLSRTTCTIVWFSSMAVTMVWRQQEKDDRTKHPFLLSCLASLGATGMQFPGEEWLGFLVEWLGLLVGTCRKMLRNKSDLLIAPSRNS